LFFPIPIQVSKRLVRCAQMLRKAIQHGQVRLDSKFVDDSAGIPGVRVVAYGACRDDWLPGALVSENGQLGRFGC
jgi:hypothetical protein